LEFLVCLLVLYPGEAAWQLHFLQRHLPGFLWNTPAPTFSSLRLPGACCPIRSIKIHCSFFIDPCGRIVDRVKDENGKDSFVGGVLPRPVTFMESNTIYEQLRGWFAWRSILVSMVIRLAAVFGKNDWILNFTRFGSRKVNDI
jgi:hypothetical protein